MAELPVLDKLPTNVWERDVVPEWRLRVVAQGCLSLANSGCFLAGNAVLNKASPAPVTHAFKSKHDMTEVLSSRQPWRSHLATRGGREALEALAPRFVDAVDAGTFEFDVDYVYLGYLEEMRQDFRSGRMTAREVSETGQAPSLIPYLMLLGDFATLMAFFKGLLKVNVGLALLLRSKLQEVWMKPPRATLERVRRCKPPPIYVRPRPPTAPLAPPTSQGLI